MASRACLALPALTYVSKSPGPYLHHLLPFVPSHLSRKWKASMHVQILANSIFVPLAPALSLKGRWLCLSSGSSTSLWKFPFLMSVLLPGVSSSWCQIFLVVVAFLIAVPLPSDCGGHPLSSGCLLMAAPFLVAGQSRTLEHGGLRIYLGQPFSGCGSLIRHPQGQSLGMQGGAFPTGNLFPTPWSIQLLGEPGITFILFLQYGTRSLAPWHWGCPLPLCVPEQSSTHLVLEEPTFSQMMR